MGFQKNLRKFTQKAHYILLKLIKKLFMKSLNKLSIYKFIKQFTALVHVFPMLDFSLR